MNKNYLECSLLDFASIVEQTDIVENLRRQCQYAANVTRFLFFVVYPEFDGEITEKVASKYKLIEEGVTSKTVGALEVVLYNAFRVTSMEEVHVHTKAFIAHVETVGELLNKLIVSDDNDNSVSDYLNLKKYLSAELVLEGDEDNFPPNDLIVFQILLELYHQYKNEQKGRMSTEMYAILAERIGLTEAELQQVNPSDGSSRWETKIRSAKDQLKKSGCLSDAQYGCWKITEKGIETIEVMRGTVTK